MDVAVPAAGALRGALQCAVAVVPECVVAECWMQGGTGEWDQLVAFLTPSPLVATHVGADGKPTQRTIDLATAQAFASQHKLSIKLATKVSMTGATEWCQESEIQNSGDVLLAKLTFGIESAIAVPVMQQRGLEATDVSCPAVLVFYSSKKEQASLSVSSALLAVGRSAGAALQVREEEDLLLPHGHAQTGQDTGVPPHAVELAFSETPGSTPGSESVTKVGSVMSGAAATASPGHSPGNGPSTADSGDAAASSPSEPDSKPVEIWQNAVLGAAKLAASTLRASCAQVWSQGGPSPTSGTAGAAFTLLAELQPHVVRPAGADKDTSSSSSGGGVGASLAGTQVSGKAAPRSARKNAAGQDSTAATTGPEVPTATSSNSDPPPQPSGGRASRSSRFKAGTVSASAGQAAGGAAAGSNGKGVGTGADGPSAHEHPAPVSASAPGSPAGGASVQGPTLPGLSSQMCAEAVATAHLQPAVWLGPHEMAARLMHYQPWSPTVPDVTDGSQAVPSSSYQAAVAVPLRVVIGSAREESRARSLNNLQNQGSKGSLGPPVTVVLVLYWADPHPTCCTPAGTAFLATVAQTARTSCATAPPPPLSATNAALTAPVTHAQRSSAAATSSSGGALPRPSSGLDLLAALGARGRAESTGYAPPSQEGGSADGAPSVATDAPNGGGGQETGGSPPARAPSMQAILRASAHDLQTLEHGGQQHVGHKRGRNAGEEALHANGGSAAGGPSGPGMHPSFSMGHLLSGGASLSMGPGGGGAGEDGLEGGLNMEAEGGEEGEESEGEEDPEGDEEGQGDMDESGMEGGAAGGGGEAGQEGMTPTPGVPTKAPGRGRRGRRHRGRSKRQSAPYSLHPSEHGHMTISGLPAVSATALARVKGRSRAPAPKMAVALRRGKWPNEEEELTTAVVDAFKSGFLPLANGTTLRTYLSGQLHCAPMRITKKFAKDASIGKQVYAKATSMPEDQWTQQSQATCSRIRVLRQRFFQAVLAKNRIDLSLIVPDPFPADGVVHDTIGQYYDDNGEPIAMGEGHEGLEPGLDGDEHGLAGMGGEEGPGGGMAVMGMGMGMGDGQYMQQHDHAAMVQQQQQLEQQERASMTQSSSKRARRGLASSSGAEQGGGAGGGGGGGTSSSAAQGETNGPGQAGNRTSADGKGQRQQGNVMPGLAQQQGGSFSAQGMTNAGQGGGMRGMGGMGMGMGQAGSSFAGLHPALNGQMGVPMTMGNMMDMAAMGMGMGMGHPMAMAGLAAFHGGGAGMGAWMGHNQYGQALMQQQQAMGMLQGLPWAPVGAAMLNGQGGVGGANGAAAAAAGFQQANEAAAAAAAAAMAAANAGQQYMMQQHSSGKYGSMVMGAPPAPASGSGGGQGGSGNGSGGQGQGQGQGQAAGHSMAGSSSAVSIGMRLPIPASSSFGMMNMPGFAMAGGMPVGMGMGMGMGNMGMNGPGQGGVGQGGRAGPAFASYADLSGLGLAMSPTAVSGQTGGGVGGGGPGGGGGGGGYQPTTQGPSSWAGHSSRNGQQGGGSMHPSASAASLGLHLDNTPLLQGQSAPARGKGVPQSDSLLDMAHAAAMESGPQQA